MKKLKIESALISVFNKDGISEICMALFRKGITIYSTGGGIVLDKQNRNALKKIGFTVFLKASIQTLYNRINNDTKKRPLLKNKPLLEKLLNQRKLFKLNNDI